MLKPTRILDGDSPSVTLSHKLFFSDKGSFLDLSQLHPKKYHEDHSRPLHC